MGFDDGVVITNGTDDCSYNGKPLCSENDAWIKGKPQPLSISCAEIKSSNPNYKGLTSCRSNFFLNS